MWYFTCNESPWSTANKKRIDSLFEWLVLIDLPNLLTYYYIVEMSHLARYLSEIKTVCIKNLRFFVLLSTLLNCIMRIL